MAPTNITFSVVLLQEDESWVAQALEYDIAAQGKTIKAAIDAFERTVIGQAVVDVSHDRQPFEGIEQAPKNYWDQFSEAKSLGDSRKPIRLPITSAAHLEMEDMRLVLA